MKLFDKARLSTIEGLARNASKRPVEIITFCTLVTCILYLCLTQQFAFNKNMDHKTAYSSSAGSAGTGTPNNPTSTGPKSRVALTQDRIIPLSTSSQLVFDSEQSLLLKQVWIESPRIASSQPLRGVLTRLTLKSLVEFDAKVRALDISSDLDNFSVEDESRDDYPVHQSTGAEDSSLTFQNLCYRRRGPHSPCVSFSPLTLWNCTDSTSPETCLNFLNKDTNILKTVSSHLSASNSSTSFLHSIFHGLRVHPGREDHEVQGASSLVLSYVLDVGTPSLAYQASLWEARVNELKTTSLYHHVTHPPSASLFSHITWTLEEFFKVSPYFFFFRMTFFSLCCRLQATLKFSW
jgi:hypothetical protein